MVEELGKMGITDGGVLGDGERRPGVHDLRAEEREEGRGRLDEGGWSTGAPEVQVLGEP